MKQQLTDQLISIRRQIHQNPELGFRETKTAALIAGELVKLALPFKNSVAETGIVAELDKGPGPCIALRADMDALPIKEETGLEFSSKTENVMHACGHDLHTTILLGAAHLLKNKEFKGRIKFIFQPSEEGTYPEVFADGPFKSGGQRMIEAGVLEDVDAALALHVYPLLPTGKIGYKTGQALAAVGFFKITITGKGGHAAFPDLTIDPVLVSSQVINNTQFIISRYTSPNHPKVISFTRIEGGVNENIIPEEVKIWGTVRALDAATYKEIVLRFRGILQGVELMSQATITLDFTLDYPSLLNDSALHSKLGTTLDRLFGAENQVEVAPLMGGEDFAFFSRKVPSMFYFLGAQYNGSSYFLHNPKVVFDEACIPLGAHLLAEAATELLKSGGILQ